MNGEIVTSLIRVLPFALILIVLLFRIRYRKINPDDLQLQKPVSVFRFLFCSIGFLVFAIAIEVLLNRLGLLEIDKWNHELLPSIIRIAGAVILAPVAEELIFRGLFLNMLIKRKINQHLGIAMQAILFVLLHNFAYENSIQGNIGIVQSYIDASLFAYARYYSKSLYTPMFMHMSGNLIATVERFII